MTEVEPEQPRPGMLQMAWPENPEDLRKVQSELAVLRPELWRAEPSPEAVGACFVCFERGRPGPGLAGDRGWAGASLFVDGRCTAVAIVRGLAHSGYEPGLLALREGPLLAEAVRRLPRSPDVLLVDATGRDHPRRAGMALHLGFILDLPTVGVTHRPLLAEGSLPGEDAGSTSPLYLAGDLVGYWVRTKRGVRPLAAHAAWRTEPETAVAITLMTLGMSRTPMPMVEARRTAREARARDG
jgi:deoxyribonuclease V